MTTYSFKLNTIWNFNLFYISLQKMEIWKDIRGYEGLYQISNYGRVKNKHGKFIALRLDKGYLKTHLWKNGKAKWHLVHRLVYETFVGKILEGMQVNHIDEDKTNNVLSNLNLMTPKENSNWGTRNKRLGETFKTNGKRSKKVDQIDKVTGEVLASFQSTKEVERVLGYSHSNIGKCCNCEYKQAYNYVWKYQML